MPGSLMRVVGSCTYMFHQSAQSPMGFSVIGKMQ